MSATDHARHDEEPRPADGTSPADAIETRSATAAGRDVAGIGKQLVGAIGKDGLTTQAAAVAYNFVFAIPPLLIFILALASVVSQAVNSDTGVIVQHVVDWLADRLPAETAMALQPVIVSALEQSGGGLVSVGAVLALFGARGAMGALVGALNVAYRVTETRGFVRRQVLAIGLTFATGLGIILAIALFLVGGQLGELVADRIGLGDTWATVWNIARFPLILVILVVALAALYWAGPNTDIPFRWLSPGAVVGVVGWVVITLFVNIYFQYAGGYATSYGPLGGVLAFIFYLYLMSLVILIGGELNALLARRVPQAGDSPAAERAAAEDAGQRFTARVDDRVRDAIRDARQTLGTPRPAASGTASIADIAPERIARDRGAAVRRLAVGASAAAAGVVAAVIRRR